MMQHPYRIEDHWRSVLSPWTGHVSDYLYIRSIGRGLIDMGDSKLLSFSYETLQISMIDFSNTIKFALRGGM